MIVFITGENDYARRSSAAEIFGDNAYQRIEAEQLSYAQLVELFSGVSLFGEATRVVIEGLSAQKELWSRIPDMIERHNDTNTVVISEAKPDKRTASYKALVAHARHIDCAAYGERDGRALERWVGDTAKQLGFTLSATESRLLVERVGYDQWALVRALEVLALAEHVDESAIIALTQQSLGANVFELFGAAVTGDGVALQKLLRSLRETEDPYRTFALLVSQAMQLAGFVFAGAGDAPAKDLSIHPYVAGKLARQAQSVSQSAMRVVIARLDDADRRMKSSSAEPWFVIEQALLQIATAR